MDTNKPAVGDQGAPTSGDKHPGGRPPQWQSPEEFESQCKGFFEWCKSEDYIPDIEALAVHLNTSRKVILDYEKKEQFSYTIKRIKDKIAFFKKQLAMKGKINSSVFCFDFKNNHGYKDSIEMDSTVKSEITEIRHRVIDSDQQK